MPAHRSHGRLYVSAPRHDEMPSGEPVMGQGEARDDRRENGTLKPGASLVPRLGGQSAKGRTSLSHRVPEDVLDENGRHRVRALRKALCSEARTTIGRGYCGVGASLLYKLVAVSTELHEQALRDGDVEAVRKHAETIRTTLAYAREECARVGEAMGKSGTSDKLAPGEVWVEEAAK